MMLIMLLTAGAAFLFGYFLNILYITVFYHRGLTHGAVRLSPATRRWVVLTGNWVTGLDPKGWACMHRMHHVYSDTPQDPHSPMQLGIWGVLPGQLHSYKRTLSRLQAGNAKYLSMVSDLDFPVNWLNRNKLWVLPYFLHVLIGLAVGAVTHLPLVGLAYWMGIMSHPLQGWMVNALSHRFGYSNYELGDHSRNNWLVALLVFGEGYQNNHHHKPESANFSAKGWEFDMGYWLCLLAEQCGLLQIPRAPEPMRRQPREMRVF
ncbi:MAG: fatty acid desaturase [Deltaproteobacteria bacterium]|nr:fatty acid desaturase [Deltaproteobacteria bacterium]